MKKCTVEFRAESMYAISINPAGKAAYDLAKGQEFEAVEYIRKDLSIEIPLHLAIKCVAFADSFSGVVNVPAFSLNWAVSWAVIKGTLSPFVDDRQIIDSWELAGCPTEWDGKRVFDYSRLSRVKLAKKIGYAERRIQRMKLALAALAGYEGQELQRCAKDTCWLPTHFNKCVGKFANVCEMS